MGGMHQMMPVHGGPRYEEGSYEEDFEEDLPVDASKKGKGKKEKKQRTPEEKEARKAKKTLKKATKANAKRYDELHAKHKNVDPNSKQWTKMVKYTEDEYVPEGRVRPKDDKRVLEQGLVIRRPDMEKACPNLDLNTRRGQRKCVKKMRADYRKEHAIVYTTECSAISNPFARRRCIKKYNRGL